MTRHDLEIRRNFAAQDAKAFEGMLKRLEAKGNTIENSDYFRELSGSLKARRNLIEKLDAQIEQLAL